MSTRSLSAKLFAFPNLFYGTSKVPKFNFLYGRPVMHSFVGKGPRFVSFVR
jgi:hypothetical protein